MTPQTWPCPLPGGATAEEYALSFNADRKWRLLIVPALFDEGNKLRRLAVEIMRRLDAAGIDSVLPDLPGCNESLQPLEVQTADDWRDAMTAAARHFGATHALGIRGGAMFMPDDVPGWRYAPVKGANIFRQLMRARAFASREAGVEENTNSLMVRAVEGGIELSGYRLGADFVREFQSLQPVPSPRVHDIEQDMVGGSGLWLRAEPGESREQADALAAILAIGIKQ